MAGLVFVDTNVFVYQHDAAEPLKQGKAAAWLQHLWRHRAGRLSYQVLCELYVTLTAKLRPGLPERDTRAIVLSLNAWRPVLVDDAVVRAAWSLQEEHSLSFWDALIVAAAQVARCTLLLSEDLAEGHEYGAVRVVNPFTEGPPA